MFPCDFLLGCKMTNIVKMLLISAAIALATTTAQAKATTDVVCSYAPSQSVVVNGIASGVGGAGAGAAAILQAAGLTAVSHSAGGYIFTGAGGYVAGTLGYAIVAPVLITASVVVGGTAIALELSCAPNNHPDAVNKVKEITAEFSRAFHSAKEKALDVRNATGRKVSELNEEAIIRRDDAIVEFRVGSAQLFAKGQAFLDSR